MSIEDWKAKKPFMKVMIGKNKKESDLTCHYDDKDQRHEEVDGIDFDGHRVLWGFAYEPYTYLKESELSGEQWRKGGYIKYFRNGAQVYEEFCRETDSAVFRIAAMLPKLMEFHWDYLVKGKKIYWRNTPAVIDYLMMDQGCMMINAEGEATFPDHVWAKEDWNKLEDNKRVKIEFFDDEIWWFRD